jgi:competence protein ComEA
MDAPPAKSTPPAAPAPSHRGRQFAFGVVLVLLFGLLAFRGYGNGLGARPTETVPPALTDLNRADRAQLEQVPGIGPGLAKRIDDHRRAKGPFRSVDELRQVRGIGTATLDKVRAYFHVDPPSVSPIEASLEPLVLERRPLAAQATSANRTPSTGKLQPGDPPIDVNSADVAQLIRIPGVGTVTAQSILAARADRPFSSIDDLDRVRGIGPKTLEKIRPYVTVK